MNRALQILAVGAVAFVAGWALEKFVPEQALKPLPENLTARDRSEVEITPATPEPRQQRSIVEIANSETDVSLKLLAALDWIEAASATRLETLLLPMLSEGELDASDHEALAFGKIGDEVESDDSLWLAAVSQWFSIAPERSLELAGDFEDGELIPYLWAIQHPEAARERARALTGTEAHGLLLLGAATRDDASSLIETAIATKFGLDYLIEDIPIDHAAAVPHILSLEDTSVAPSLLQSVFSNWAKSDPTQALHAASQIDDPEMRTAAEAAALVSFTKTDPMAAANRLVDLPDHLTRHTKAFNEISSALLSRDPKELADWLESFPSGKQRNLIAQFLLDSRRTAHVDFDTGMRFFELAPKNEQTRRRVGNTARKLAIADPARAIDWLQAQEEKFSFEESDTRETASTIAHFFANHNSDEAITARNRITDPALRADYTSGLARWLGERDFEKGIEWANALPTTERDLAIAQLIGSYDDLTPEIATASLEQLTEPSARGRLIDAAMEKLDAGAGLEWIAANEPDHETAAKIVAQHDTFEHIANRNPAKALELALPYAETEAFPEIASNLTKQWLYNDPEAATQFVTETLAPGDAQQQALLEVAKYHGKRNIAEGLAWVAAIDDSTKRQKMTTSFLRDTGSFALSTAEKIAFIEGSSLPDEDKSHFLKAFGAKPE